MTSKILPVLVIVGALALTGCTGNVSAGAEPDARTAESSATPSASPSPSAGYPFRDKVASVSEMTTCRMLFGRDVDGPALEAIDLISDFIKTPGNVSARSTRTYGVLTELDAARAGAEPVIEPHISVLMDTLYGFARKGSNSADAEISMTAYRNSGEELINVCTPHLGY